MFNIPRRVRPGGHQSSKSHADDGRVVDSEVAVEIVDVTDLAEVLDAECRQRRRVDGGDKAECVGMSIEHRDGGCRTLWWKQAQEDLVTAGQQTLAGL